MIIVITNICHRFRYLPCLIVSIYKPASYGRASTLKVLTPGLACSAILHISAVVALLWAVQAPARMGGSPTVTVSLIDAVDATAKKLSQPPQPKQLVKPEPAPRPLAKTETTKENTEEDTQNSVAAQASSKQGEPTEQEALRDAQYSADYLHNPKPIYPPLSRRLGEQGQVLLHVQVSAEGEALQVNVKQSSGFKRLDQAAMDVVRHWQFVPAKQGNTAQISWVDVPLQFSLLER